MFLLDGQKAQRNLQERKSPPRINQNNWSHRGAPRVVCRQPLASQESWQRLGSVKRGSRALPLEPWPDHSGLDVGDDGWMCQDRSKEGDVPGRRSGAVEPGVGWAVEVATKAREVEPGARSRSAGWGHLEKKSQKLGNRLVAFSRRCHGRAGGRARREADRGETPGAVKGGERWVSGWGSLVAERHVGAGVWHAVVNMIVVLVLLVIGWG